MLNKVLLIGNLGKDIEIKTFESGDKIGNFSLATNENYKDKNAEWQTITQWHNIQVKGKYIEALASRIKKGDSVVVEGMLKYRQYEKDGQKRTITFVETFMVKPTPKNRGENTTSNDAPPPPPLLAPTNEQDDDLPF